LNINNYNENMAHKNSLLITIIIVTDHMIPCHGTVIHDVQDYKRAKFRNEMTTDQKRVTAPMAVRIHACNQSMNH
jgi:hypothetical protein